MTAIVGPSGSGKTTFCNLISRFWDVNSGEICLGGKNIKDYSLEYLMNNISMVFQDVYLFADTIENNIKFGCPNASRDDVIAAAKKAQCHDFISALPDGYQSMIGEGTHTPFPRLLFLVTQPRLQVIRREVQSTDKARSSQYIFYSPQ